MDHKEEVFVVLLIKYDPQLIDHPKFWDWATLIDCAPNDVEMVESFDYPYDENTDTTTDNSSNS